MRRFIDIGANLTDSVYSGIYNGSKKHQTDLENVLERSWKVGLEKIIITGTSLVESEKALTLSETNAKLYSTVGCHPTNCTEFETKSYTPSTYLENLSNLITKGGNKVVAYGEFGLDYDRLHFCPKEIQKKYFELQLNLARNFELPLFIHCRNASEDLYGILKNHNFEGVVHSFDGTLDEATKLINLGYFIGINGCSLKTQSNLETVKQLPCDKILLETDCPWCEIRPTHAGYQFITEKMINAVKKEKWKPDCLVKSRNEPCNIVQILDVVSAVKNRDPSELCEIIYRNTNKLFFHQ